MIYPINFSIPECKILKHDFNFKKTKFMSPLVPGKLETYIYKSEEDYYKNYQNCYFGKTTRKAGWDCLRHYEILANGCIPWFEDIEHIPEKTMTRFPKTKIQSIMELAKYNTIVNETTTLSLYFLKVLDETVNELLEYTRENLTTKAMARYVFNCIGIPESVHSTKKILYLSQNLAPDYLRCLMLHGFKELLGKNCHDYPKVPHIYKSFPEEESLKIYGKGFTYTRLLDDSETRDDSLDNIVEDNIKGLVYDYIVYGSCHRGLPFWDVVNSYYKPDKIILFCGEDLHECQFKKMLADTNYHLFIREY